MTVKSKTSTQKGGSIFRTIIVKDPDAPEGRELIKTETVEVTSNPFKKTLRESQDRAFYDRFGKIKEQYPSPMQVTYFDSTSQKENMRKLNELKTDLHKGVVSGLEKTKDGALYAAEKTREGFKWMGDKSREGIHAARCNPSSVCGYAYQTDLLEMKKGLEALIERVHELEKKDEVVDDDQGSRYEGGKAKSVSKKPPAKKAQRPATKKAATKKPATKK